MSSLHAPDIRRARPLSGLTTFGIGGPAEYVALPATEARAVEIMNLARAEETDVRILGGGSDLLVLDEGVKGLVVRLPEGEVEARGRRVRFPAGMRLARAVDACRRIGLSGLEELAGIPGTVGGSAVKNASAFGRTFGELVASVGVLEGEGVEEFSKESCRFAYRSSALSGRTVLWAELELAEASPARISRRIGELLAERRRRFPPGRSAGCVFKNGRLPAGAVIEALGLKGARSGRAEVSRRHANFIVNLGGATADDVCRLIAMIREKARIEAGVTLELEVEVWGG